MPVHGKIIIHGEHKTIDDIWVRKLIISLCMYYNYRFIASVTNWVQKLNLSFQCSVILDTLYIKYLITSIRNLYDSNSTSSSIVTIGFRALPRQVIFYNYLISGGNTKEIINNEI